MAFAVFKTVAGALARSWVGSTPTHSRQMLWPKRVRPLHLVSDSPWVPSKPCFGPFSPSPRVLHVAVKLLSEHPCYPTQSPPASAPDGPKCDIIWSSSHLRWLGRALGLLATVARASFTVYVRPPPSRLGALGVSLIIARLVKPSADIRPTFGRAGHGCSDSWYSATRVPGRPAGR